MRWSARKRSQFIEARLFWDGKIGRKDLTDFFNISVPQATKDIKDYTAIAPENIAYDTRAKQYVSTPDFEPKMMSLSSDKYLTRLRILKDKKEVDKFFYGSIPPFAEMPQFRRFVDTGLLRTLVSAINNHEAIKVTYQSMSSPRPKTRWLTPHSLGYSGARWHIRALCHSRRSYRDFVLGRILSVEASGQHHFDHSIDYEWHTKIEIKISPNPLLAEGKRLCIERDYCMDDGQATLNMRAAFFYYFKQQHRMNISEATIDDSHQIQLLNDDEINAQVDLLKSMTKSHINELVDAGKIVLYDPAISCF